MFGVRWRWAASISLALPRFRGGKKIPPQIARMNAEDLLASVFPDQVACARESARRDRGAGSPARAPDHSRLPRRGDGCRGFERVLRGLESGEIRVIARDVTEPSPLALEVMSARPYALPRRCAARRAPHAGGDEPPLARPESASDIGKLDAAAVDRVREEAWPDSTSPDELHDSLLWLGFMTDAEVRANSAWPALLEQLAAQGRVTLRHTRGPVVCHGAPLRSPKPPIRTRSPSSRTSSCPRTQEILLARRSHRRARARPPRRPRPHHAERARERLRLTALRHRASIGRALQAEGFAMRGQFTPGVTEEEWCERRLLARIHRYTVKRLRAEIEPVPAARLPALPVRMAARDAEQPACRAPMPSPRSSASSKASKRRQPRWKRKSSRPASTNTNPRGSTSSASPAASSGRASPSAHPAALSAAPRR